MQVRPAAALAVKDDEGGLLLTRRTDDRSWCLPGGHLEAGESWIEAALREFEEETGCRAAVDGLLGVYSDPATQTHTYPSGDRFHFVGVVFEGRLVSGRGEPDSETVEWRFFSPGALPQQLMDIDRVVISDAFSSSGRPFIR